ncbi:MAG: YjgN family protein [Neomegalonema sp.]|nr:YjgN family protein [Neomegalonema sp.]
MSETSIAGGNPAPVGATPLAFSGEAGKLVGIVVKGLLLTLVTLGIYRFWMKTRIRHYYWQNIQIGNEPLEYTGRGLELFIGFLIAIFFLAIYLFVVNFALSGFNLIFLQEPSAFNFLPLVVLTPLIPYAQFRSQRYLLSRTKWRGIRFGLERGAASYAGRAMLWWVAIVLSLGLAAPFADFDLRRFITKRTYYGDQRFNLSGSATGLFKHYLAIWLFVALIVGLIVISIAMEEGRGPGAAPSDLSLLFPLGFIFFWGYIGLIFGGLWYAGKRTSYMMNRTEFGEGVLLQSKARPWRLVGIVIIGGLLAGLVMTGVMVVIGILMAIFGAFLDAETLQQIGVLFDPERTETLGPDAYFAIVVSAVMIGLLYLGVTLAAMAAAELFIAKPYLAHLIDTAAVTNIDRAYDARQRPQDRNDEAEGFADALDVGAF